MIPAGRFTDWWAHLTSPLVAGALAVAFYDKFLRRPGPVVEIGDDAVDFGTG